MPNRSLSRRHLLQSASVALGAAAGCSDDALPDEPIVPIPAGMSAVGVVGGADVAAAVERAVALAGGINEIKPGDTVFIKPNVVHPATRGFPAVVTSPEVLAAVIRLVRRRRPSKIIVGDRPSRIFTSELVFRLTGIREAAMAAGADEVFEAPIPTRDPSEWVMVRPPGWEGTWGAQGGILAMRKILEADHFIEVPVCKNHRWAGVSLSMKNLIGAVGDSSRDAFHFNEGDPDRLSRDIAVMNQAFRPLISIIDARSALINGGPEGVGTDRVTVTPGLIFAGRDRVALDAAAASLIKMELERTAVPMPDAVHAYLRRTRTWALPQIVHGAAHGLGVASADRVALRFEGVAESAAIEAVFRA